MAWHTRSSRTVYANRWISVREDEVTGPGGDGIYAGKVRPDTATGDEMMALIAADQPFVLAETTDGRGSTIDPNAPVATPDPTAAPVDNTGLPVVEGVKGQTAADYTCSITQVSSGDED